MSKIKRYAIETMGEGEFQEFLDAQMEGAKDGNNS